MRMTKKKIDVADTEKWAAKVQSAENHLLSLLSPAESGGIGRRARLG